MKYITNSSYNDVAIIQPQYGINFLTNKIYSTSIQIQAVIEDKQSNNNMCPIYINDEYSLPSSYNAYMLQLELNIQKDIVSENIAYYKFTETMSANDPMSYFCANKLSNTDTLKIIWFNDKRHTNYNKLRLHLSAHAEDDSYVFGSELSGDIKIYALC